MPSLKETARTIVLKNWPVGDDVFDAMWATLSKVPRPTGPRRLASLLSNPSLAGTGTHTEQVAIAVFVFAQAAQELPDDATRDQVLLKLTELGDLFGQKGIVHRIRKTWIDPGDNAALRAFATVYTHEAPQAKTATKEETDQLVQHRAAYTIFVYHQRHLHPDIIGEIYFNGRSMRKQPAAGKDPAADRDYITAREYAILRHILKSQDRADMRTTPALVEYCWRDSERAKDLREKYNNTTTKRDVYHELSAGVRGTISKLSKILYRSIGVRLLSSESGIYAIAPPLLSYCVIDESA